MKGKFLRAAIASGCLLGASTAGAALSGGVPEAIDPGRLGTQQVAPTPATGTIDIPRDIARAAKEKSPEMENVIFILDSITLRGAKLHQQAAWQRLQELARPYFGKPTSLADIQRIAESLEDMYRSSGFMLTQVFLSPQQLDKEAANIVLEVIEGYITSVSLHGGTIASQQKVNDFAAKMLAEKPVTAASLEEFILLSSTIPGVQIQTVLSASEREAGGADLDVTLVQKRFSGYIGLNNRSGSYVGPYQLQLGATAYSLLGADSLGLNGAIPYVGGGRMHYGGVSYTNLLNRYGTFLNLNYNHTTSRPGGSLSNLNLRGLSDYFEIGCEHPFIKTKIKHLDLVAGYYARNSNNASIAFGTNLYDDRIRAAYVGLNFDRTVRFGGFQRGEVKLVKHVRSFQSSKRGAPLLSRAHASASFSKMTGNLSHIQSVGDQFSCELSAEGQYGFSALLASEQYGYGGSRFGGGYDSSEITGDRGLSLRIEPRWDGKPEYVGLRWYQLFAYMDIGKVWNIVPEDPALATSVVPIQTASSWGGGTRLQFPGSMTANFEIGVPINHKVGSRNNKMPRFFFNVSKLF